MELERKIVKMEIKAAGEADFEGLLSVMGVKDLDGEIVDEGAFTRTLKHKNGRVPLLADHDHRGGSRLGVAILEEQGKNLHLKGLMNLEKEIARDTLSDIRFNLKHEIATGLSIGFQTIKDAVVEGVRHLKEVALWEGSVVTFPANPEAIVTSSKSKKNFNLDLAGIVDYAESLRAEASELSPATVKMIEGGIQALTALLPTQMDAGNHSIYDDWPDSAEETDEAIEKFAKFLRDLRQE